MTDDLVNELRTTTLFETGEWESGLGLEAADRIDADAATIARLDGENADLIHDLERIKDSETAYLNAFMQAEAKIAALVEALERIGMGYVMPWSAPKAHDEAVDIARAAIAAAKGGA